MKNKIIILVVISCFIKIFLALTTYHSDVQVYFFAGEVLKSGKILGFSTETLLPKSISDKELNEHQLQFVSELGRKLFLIYGINSSEIKNDAFITTTNGGYIVYFPLKGDTDVLLGSLELILSQLNRTKGNFKIEDDKMVNPTTIDLRYVNPVLR